MHWFCPRQYDDDLTNYADVDSPQHANGLERQSDGGTVRQLVDESKRRAEIAVMCLHVLTLETEDLASAADWYKRRLNELMGKCDSCVRAYHKGQKRLLEKLAGQVYLYPAESGAGYRGSLFP